MSTKIIAVTGATGAQGGGLVRAILADTSGNFVARAITRKVDSDKAKELAKLGVEVVVYRTFGFAGADDLGNMFQYKRDFETEYCASRPLALSRELNPELARTPQVEDAAHVS